MWCDIYVSVHGTRLPMASIFWQAVCVPLQVIISLVLRKPIIYLLSVSYTLLHYLIISFIALINLLSGTPGVLIIWGWLHCRNILQTFTLIFHLGSNCFTNYIKQKNFQFYTAESCFQLLTCESVVSLPRIVLMALNWQVGNTRTLPCPFPQ